MLEALVAGTSDAEALADLARGTLRGKIPQLQQALNGNRVQDMHQRFLLGQLLAHVTYLENAIAQVQSEEKSSCVLTKDLEFVQSIPGVHAEAAAAIVAEIGTDMTRFPDAAHLASWAGVCPGNNR